MFKRFKEHDLVINSVSFSISGVVNHGAGRGNESIETFVQVRFSREGLGDPRGLTLIAFCRNNKFGV